MSEFDNQAQSAKGVVRQTCFSQFTSQKHVDQALAALHSMRQERG